jgi:hypothetical protein
LSHAIQHVLVVDVLFLLLIILSGYVLDYLLLYSVADLASHIASILDCLDWESFKKPEGEEVHDDLKQVGIGAGVEELEIAQRPLVFGRLERVKVCANAVFPDRVQTHLAEHSAEVDGRLMRVGSGR